MVLLGGLEFVAAGYLLNERKKFHRETARQVAEEDLRARGFRPEGMEEHAAKRNEEIMLHRRQTGLLGPPMVGTPGARPLSAPGFVERDQKDGWQQSQPPHHHHNHNQFGPGAYSPQPQYHQPHPQYHSPYPNQYPGYGPPQGPYGAMHMQQPPPQINTPPYLPPHMQFQQNGPVPMTPPPAYAPAASVPVRRGYAPPMEGQVDGYAREQYGWREHGRR